MLNAKGPGCSLQRFVHRSVSSSLLIEVSKHRQHKQLPRKKSRTLYYVPITRLHSCEGQSNDTKNACSSAPDTLISPVRRPNVKNRQRLAHNRSPANQAFTSKTSGNIPLAKEAFQIQHKSAKVNVKRTEKKPIKSSIHRQNREYIDFR
jgi:hypothetical protein